MPSRHPRCLPGLNQLAPLFALAAACGGKPGPPVSDGGASAAATQQMVFMMQTSTVPTDGGANAILEVALINLDGTGLRQLTNDGTQKFLPHLSPDATKVVYTKFTRGGYGSADAQSEIAVFDLASNTETLLTSGGGSSQATFSPDGRRVAYGAGGLTHGTGGERGLYVVNVDGTDAHRIGGWSGTDEELVWGDYAWSSTDWILFTVAQKIDGCFKVRLDKIRPDGSDRTKITDGGPSCTPDGFEQSGDADPGWSADGKTIYSSRGFPTPAAGSSTQTERKLYAFDSDAWYPGKPETDLSLPSRPSCVEGVPKGSPEGKRILLFRRCFDGDAPAGIYVTDAAGSYRTFVTDGFGPDWNPTR